MNRLCLGTAQFGMDYGASNTVGQVARDEVERILDRALSAGIDMLDTAILYGESEAALGAAGADRFRVVTKLPPIPHEVSNVLAWVREHADWSMTRLGVSRLDGLLLHRPSDVAGPRGTALVDALGVVRDEGLVAATGVSIYGPEDLDQVFGEFLDVVQAPYNVLDRRLKSSGLLQRLADSGTAVHVRSAFLQGVLLMEPTDLRGGLADLAPSVGRFQRWAREMDLSPLEAAVGHVLSVPEIDRLVFGVESLVQLNEVIAASRLPPVQAPDELAVWDASLIDPSRWP